MSLSGKDEIHHLQVKQRTVMPKQAGIRVTPASVIPLENGIQVMGTGMDPGFHRGDDKAGKTERAVDIVQIPRL